jgi:translocation and assembly module TamB
LKLKKLTPSILIACCLIVFIGSYYILHSETGTQLIFKMVEKAMGDHLKIQQIRGHLLGKLEIEDLTFNNSAYKIHFDHLTTNSSFHITSFKLVFRELNIKCLEIKPYLSNFNKSASSQALVFPFPIAAPNIHLENTKFILGAKNCIQLPNLLASLNALGNTTYFTIWKENDKGTFVKVEKDSKRLLLTMKLPINKTEWELKYQENAQRFLLSGSIYDQQNGGITLLGGGYKNNKEIQLIAKNFHANNLWLNYWPGAINVDLVFKQSNQKMQFDLINLTGNIHDQPIKGRGFIELYAHKIKNLNFNLYSHDSIFFISKEHNTDSKINCYLESPEINVFLPKSKGHLYAKWTLNLSANPFIKGEIAAKNIAFSDFNLDLCQADFYYDLKNKIDSYLQLSANNFTFSRMKFKQILLRANGSFKKHNISLEAKAQNQQASIQLTGKYEQKQWIVNITDINIANNAQAWHLVHPTDFTIDKQGFLLNTLSLNANESHLSLNCQHYFGKGIKGELNLNAFDISLLSFLFPENYALEGKLNLKAKVNLLDSHTFSLEAQLSPGVIHYLLNNEAKRTRFNGGKVFASLEKDNLNSDLAFEFPEGHVNSKIQILNAFPVTAFREKKIHGNVNFEIIQIKFLESIVPMIKNITGNVIGRYRLSGPILNPNLNGETILTNGSFQIPKLQLAIKNVNLTAKQDSINTILYHGNLASGNGILDISGITKMTNGKFPVNLSIQGNHVLICDQPEIKIFASPTMNVDFSDNKIKLTGKIILPEATLHPHEFGSTETVSDEIIFIHPNGKQHHKSNLQIASSIQLVLGNQIVLNTHGIKGQVLGHLQIDDSPDKATVAYGQLWLKSGSYQIYGKTLQIDDGKLLFTGGPISNPGLSIKASRTLQVRSDSLFSKDESIKAGVSVTGTLQDPKINLFSEPAGKNSADILSCLILGMPINSLNPKDNNANAQMLLQAADAINLSGNNQILNLKNKLKNRLGLEELDIGTLSEINPSTQETISHTAFMLGKYLSPKFYVNYSLDLFDHTNTFKIRYLLNRFWTIQSIANTNKSGIDVMYTVEK